MKFNKEKLNDLICNTLFYEDHIGKIEFKIEYDTYNCALNVYVEDMNDKYLVISIELKDNVILDEIKISGREHLIQNHKCRRLDRVMNVAHFLLLYLDVSYVQLEDMSQFTIVGNCNKTQIGGRELRILQGKKSIYDKYNYKKMITSHISERDFSEMNIRDITDFKMNMTVNEFTSYMLQGEYYTILTSFIDDIYKYDDEDIISLFKNNKYYCDDIRMIHKCNITLKYYI